MAPKDYRDARIVNDDAAKDECYRIIVDKRPYYPNLNIEIDNEKSICTVVSEVLSLSLSSSWKVSKVTGGITNALFQVSGLSATAFDSVLVRVFGGEGLIDRDDETSCYASLCDAGMAYQYLGRFGNGRIEGWLEGYRPLQVKEMPLYSTQIAQQMATLHTFTTDSASSGEEPVMWNQLWDWMKQAMQGYPHDADVAAVQDELTYCQSNIDTKSAKTGFCHNDLLAANIMLSDKEKRIQLIDFEYGGCNYIAFDIANHFNEYAGGTDNAIPNYTLLPTTDQQTQFVQAYCNNSTTYNNTQDANLLYQQVQGFIMINHLYWGLWAINQAKTEGCEEFDYWTYSKNRIQQYHVCKQQNA